jgi:hypothetical protein
MLKPITYSLNNHKQLPVYDYNDIIKYEPDHIELWFERNDIIIIDCQKITEKTTEINAEFEYLNQVLNTINKLEEELNIK